MAGKPSPAIIIATFVGERLPKSGRKGNAFNLCGCMKHCQWAKALRRDSSMRVPLLSLTLRSTVK